MLFGHAPGSPPLPVTLEAHYPFSKLPFCPTLPACSVLESSYLKGCFILVIQVYNKNTTSGKYGLLFMFLIVIK